MRVVLDTGVLVAALITTDTPPALIYQAWRKKRFDLVSKVGVLRPRDLDAYGIPRTYLSRLLATGKLRRIGRGLYVLPDSKASEHRSLDELWKYAMVCRVQNVMRPYLESIAT